jgi:hypothetical protein
MKLGFLTNARKNVLSDGAQQLHPARPHQFVQSPNQPEFGFREVN